MPSIDPGAVLWNEVDGVVVVLQFSSGHFFELNKTGSAFWKLLVDGNSPDDIVRKMTQTFNVSAEKLSSDLSQFITSMVAQGLLQE